MSDPAQSRSQDTGLVVIETSLGWIGVAMKEGGIAACTSLRATRESVLNVLLSYWPDAAVLDESRAAGLVERLRRYAKGEAVSFEDFRCDLADSTPFQKSVLEVVQKIPWGQTWSYADVARAVGKPHAARAVGQVMARNPVPLIVPCHRVIASDGGPGGFSGVNGVKAKLWLLALENVHLAPE